MDASRTNSALYRSIPRDGFTLVELLATIGIAALLVTLLLSTMSTVQMAAARAKCVANLSGIAAGFRLYANENGGNLPRGWSSARAYSWQYDVAPYLGLTRANTHGAFGTIWQCPAVPARDIGTDGTIATYSVNQNLLYGSGPVKNLTRVESPSLTILLGDCGAQNTDVLQAIVYNGGQGTVAFRHPSRTPGNPSTVQVGRLKYRGEGVANFAFCDGHIEGLKPTGVAQAGSNSVIWQP